jgi:hypothetical protein
MFCMTYEDFLKEFSNWHRGRFTKCVTSSLALLLEGEGPGTGWRANK